MSVIILTIVNDPLFRNLDSSTAYSLLFYRFLYSFIKVFRIKAVSSLHKLHASN